MQAAMELAVEIPWDIELAAAQVVVMFPMAFDSVEQTGEAITRVASALHAERLAERERCAAFAFAKHDWPTRWIASSLRGENDGYTNFCTAIRSQTGGNQ